MKIYIAYESKYGNGKRCVEYLESSLKAKGHDVRSASVRAMKPEAIPTAELYIFSSPTHVGGPPGKMKKFLKKMTPKPEGTKYSMMTTCMDPNSKTLEKMEKLIAPHGLKKVSEGLKIKVTGMKGPLEDGFEKKLDTFSNDIITRK